jgi:hypothetical protein
MVRRDAKIAADICKDGAERLGLKSDVCSLCCR